MSILRFHTVAGRLGFAFGAQILLLCVTVAIAVLSMRTVGRDVQDIESRLARAIEAANAIERTINTQAIALRDTLIGQPDADRLAKSLKIVGDAVKANDQATQVLAKTLTSPQDRALFEDMVAARKAYAAEGWKVVGLIKQGQLEQAGIDLGTKVQPVQARYFDSVSHIRARAAEAMEFTAADAHATATRATLAMSMMALLAVAVGVLLALLITRALLRQLGGEPADVVHLAGEIANGNLAVHVPTRGSDVNSAMAAMGRMRDQLALIVRNVRHNVDSMATGTAEIATGNAHLSQRTETQASALQQTAATMDQLGTTVRQNADNAHRADELASNARQVANSGGKVVDQVAETMKGLSTSSSRIADITGVIDGIAFQTNILALNAAVEAARAGEQGRGFAVVASEVRTLAQRSAEAAREIKGLIGSSVGQIESGASLADQAGRTMKDVVAAISQVSELVSEISVASAQQRDGISQVGEAVNQLDQATQQNAALVEQSAAAAESLRQQSALLVQSVAVFRLS